MSARVEAAKRGRRWYLVSYGSDAQKIGVSAGTSWTLRGAKRKALRELRRAQSEVAVYRVGEP